MSEIQTPCPICGKHIEPDQPDAVLTEKSEDHPGYGQQHDIIWSRVGFPHQSCLVGARGFRPAAEST
jgi:hypothetical protein